MGGMIPAGEAEVLQAETDADMGYTYVTTRRTANFH